MKLTDVTEGYVHSPEHILKRMASDIEGSTEPGRKYCHSFVARAIRDGKVSDNDYIFILGGKTDGVHSIVAKSDGTPVIDSFKGNLVKFENGKYFYRNAKEERVTHGLNVTKWIKVSDFKKKYIDG